jgi:hypothetical protein
VGSFADPDFSPPSSPPFVYGNILVARSEPSPLRIVFAENEPEGARTEGSGDGEMKYRRATIVADDWHGSYDEWATLGPQPPYFARARDDRAFPFEISLGKDQAPKAPLGTAELLVLV